MFLHSRAAASGLVIVASFLLLSVLACQAPSLAAPTPTLTATPTNTPTPTHTPTPTRTPTPTPDPLGALSGQLVGGKTGDPIADAQIILCKMADEAAENCTLLGSPTALSDDKGAVLLEGIVPGLYTLVYGLTDELLLTSDEWDAQVVSILLLSDPFTISDASSVFWTQSGCQSVGETTMSINANGVQISDGSFTATASGITVGFKEGKFVPTIEIAGGETLDFDWDIANR